MSLAHNHHLRVSAADRAAVADLLATHYGDGRLDRPEFDERVTRAMAAKTGRDFQGLFNDLPDLTDTPSDPTGKPAGPPSPASRLPAHRRRRHGPVFPGLVVLVLIVVGWHHLSDWAARPWAWLVILVAAVIIMLASRIARR